MSVDSNPGRHPRSLRTASRIQFGKGFRSKEDMTDGARALQRLRESAKNGATAARIKKLVERDKKLQAGIGLYKF